MFAWLLFVTCCVDRYFYPPTFKNDKLYSATADALLPHGRFTLSVKFLHDFQLRIPYVVRKPASNGPISAAAYSRYASPAARIDEARHIVQSSSTPSKVNSAASLTVEVKPDARDSEVSDRSADDSPLPDSGPHDASPARDDGAAQPHGPLLEAYVSESIADILGTNALLTAGPVAFAVAQASECAWLVFDVKVGAPSSWCCVVLPWICC